MELRHKVKCIQISMLHCADEPVFPGIEHHYPGTHRSHTSLKPLREENPLYTYILQLLAYEYVMLSLAPVFTRYCINTVITCCNMNL